MNKFLDNFLRNTLWIWLPFFALFALSKELLLKMSGEEKK